MRKEYEKLKKQYRRFAHQEKNRVMTEVEESSGELRKLSKKLDVSLIHFYKSVFFHKVLV